MEIIQAILQKVKDGTYIISILYLLEEKRPFTTDY